MRYKEGSLDANARRFRAAEKQLAVLHARLEKFDRDNGYMYSRACVCAFVVFNSEDSKRHCMEDYEGSHSALKRWMQVRRAVGWWVDRWVGGWVGAPDGCV